MKKFLLAIATISMIAGLSACKGDGAQSAADKEFADSLGISFGEFYAKNLEMQIAQLKMQFGDKFNEDEYKRGIDEALKLDTANISRMIGLSTGIQATFQLYQWAQTGVNVDPAVVRNAIAKAFNDSTIDTQAAYFKFQQLSGRVQEIQERKAAEARAVEAEANLAAGEKYVAEQKAADSSIQTTESGLSYKIIEAGDQSNKPGEGASVKVIYTGKLIDGTQFDSSNGEAIEFNVDGVVPGFSEGLKLLGKGGKAVLYIPGNLAYGESGQPHAGIGPNAMLVFDVEVADIEPAVVAE